MSVELEQVSKDARKFADSLSNYICSSVTYEQLVTRVREVGKELTSVANRYKSAHARTVGKFSREI